MVVLAGSWENQICVDRNLMLFLLKKKEGKMIVSYGSSGQLIRLMGQERFHKKSLGQVLAKGL